jgi:lysyl-tRNA synthetase, class I
MYWADSIVQEVKTRYKDAIAQGKPIIIRDEKTASGRVHVGSLRGVAIHGIISELLTEAGIKNEFIFEINDFDPMDGLPVYLDQATFLPHMGKPLCEVPSPDNKAKNFAEYFASEFIGVIKELGFTPRYTRSSELYRSGAYNETIRQALVSAATVRAIYKDVSGAVKEDTWLPLNVVCEQCGKVGTTRASDFDGQTVAYTCGDYVKWAKGCGKSGRISPFDGKAKLPWKAEWPAKFTIYDVAVEGGGKDHSTRGGSRQIADEIARQVYHREPPINIPYEFFVVGGKKMSSSKGAGSSAREIADLLPPQLLRFLLIYKEPQRVIDFIQDGDTIPILFDAYDEYAARYFGGVQDDFAEVFRLAHPFKQPLEKGSDGVIARSIRTTSQRPRFSQVAYLAQMPHVDSQKEFEKLSGLPFTPADKDELAEREHYAQHWLSACAPEDYRFEIQETLPAAAKALSAEQKKALGDIAAFVKNASKLDGQVLHTALHDIRSTSGLTPKLFFEALYTVILGKQSGPKAGWFLSVMDKAFLEERLTEASRS